MFGVENLVLSKPLNEANSTPNQYRHASRQNSTTTQSNDSFVSINSEYDNNNNTDSSMSTPMLSSAYSRLFASFSSSRTDLINRLDTMSECPDYLMPRLCYSNMSQAMENANSESSKPQQRSTPPARMIHENSKFHYTDDFILLTEFSEIEGPKPLLTIPTDGGTGFNKNDYSVHLMCVDFHSHLQFKNDSDSRPAFTLTQDTSIINYWDTGCTMITACVHHFTLYDLDARGFVRPFCMAYISYDQKPVTFFEPIRTKFNEITSLLKKSNLNVFKEELEQRCADLKFTKEFFVAWCDAGEERRKELIDEHKLDDRTRARLNHSSSTEAGRTQQVNAIDTMIGEMDGILNVIVDELKSKNWLKQAKPNNDMELNRSLSEAYPAVKNQSRTQRSNTYPYTDEAMARSSLLTIKVDHEYSSQQSINSKKSSNRHATKLFKNILIGNNIMTSFNSEVLNTYQKPTREMKRLHQLCVDTAKKAINELKIMQRYFSTPHCLLKFNQITHNLTADGNLPDGKTDRSNLFWSMTIGDCAISSFFSVDKQVEVSKRGKKVISIKPAVETKTNCAVDRSNSCLSPSSTSQLQSTQFFSPKGNETTRKDTSESVYLDAVTSSDVNPSNSTLINSQNTAKELDQEDEDSQQDSKSSFSWSELKKYLESSEIDDEKVLIARPQQTETGSFMNRMQGSQYFEEGEDFYASIDELGSASINQAIGDKRLLVKDQKKEENEYDFANSLMTIEYKPYNQYAMNFNYKNLYLSQCSLVTTVSLSSSSVGMYYKTINSLRYQSNLTDKLIQINEFNYEETLKKLIATYANIMPHLLYSLLKGKPVICVVRSCSDLYYLESVVDCLSNFLPNSFYCLNSLTHRAKLVTSSAQQHQQQQPSTGAGDYAIPKYTSSPCQQKQFSASSQDVFNKSESTTMPTLVPQLRAIHQRKPIRLNDLKYCKLFGLCLMCSKEGCCSSDCASGLNHTNQSDQASHSYPHKHKHYHQNKKQNDADLLLEYIPITVRNYVSIFDLDNQTFYGPKYTGTHLIQCVNKCKSLQQDSIIYLYLIANVFKFYVKAAFVHNYSVLFESNLEQALNKRRASELVRQNATASGGGRSFLSRASEFMHKSVQVNHASSATTPSSSSTNTSPTTSLPSPRRKASSYQITHHADLNARKNKLINYYTNLVHLSRMGSNDSVSSRSSFATNGTIRSTPLDLEFLKLIMNGPTITTTSTSPTYSSYLSVTLNSASSSALLSSLSFDQSDMNIVTFLIRSLRAKQIYIYNMAMNKKQRMMNNEQACCNDDWNQDQLLSSQTDHSYESQLPLFVDYDEMTMFTVKKK